MEALIHSLSELFFFYSTPVFRRKLRQADRQLQTFSLKPKTSTSEGPQARHECSSGVTLTVGFQEKHLTFIRHGAGSPVPKL